MTRPCILHDIDWRSPLAAFAPLAHSPYALLLHSSPSERPAQWSIIAAFPDDIIEQTGGDPLSRLRELPTISGAPGVPFCGGYAGLLSYELGCSLEHTPRAAKGDWPDMAMGYYPCAALFNHETKQAFIAAPDLQKAQHFAKKLGRDAPDDVVKPLAPPGPIRRQPDKDEILDAVRRVKDYIRAGDIFQANISQESTVDLSVGDTPWAFFLRLTRCSPAPFGAYFCHTPDQVLTCNSPERFLSISPAGTVEARPIKGTRPRDDNPERDRVQSAHLQKSEKDRAENLMIVDLMRNDLSRVCAPGSVTVPRLFDLESYANVHHLVSVVRGQLPKDTNPADLLRATFPPGSITGAPKIRAMQIIAQTERAARGPYYGALGYISANGNVDFNVLIRTALLTRKGQNWRAQYRTGGGIVADSDPVAEYREMRDKAAALDRAARG